MWCEPTRCIIAASVPCASATVVVIEDVTVKEENRNPLDYDSTWQTCASCSPTRKAARGALGLNKRAVHITTATYSSHDLIMCFLFVA